MADEINVLSTRGSQTDGFVVDTIFIFPVPSATTADSGATVIPTPAASLSTEEREIVADPWQSSMDSGGAVYERFSYDYDLDLSASENATQLRNIYDTRKSRFSEIYNRRYRFWGVRLDR